MKYSRLERLKIEKDDNSDDWIMSFCASHIIGLAPVLWLFPFGFIFYIIYTTLFMIFWKKVILRNR